MNPDCVKLEITLSGIDCAGAGFSGRQETFSTELRALIRDNQELQRLRVADAHIIANQGGRINELEARARAYDLLRNMATWAYTAHDDMVQLSITFDKQPMRPIHGEVLAADELDKMTGFSPKEYFCALEGFDPDVGSVPKCEKRCATCAATACQRCGRQADERDECTDEKCALRDFYTMAKPAAGALPEIYCSRHGRVGSKDGSCPSCGKERALKRPITPDYHRNPLVIRRCAECAHEWRANADGRICPGCGKEASE